MNNCCSKPELSLMRRFENTYARSRQPVMLAIERQVCGCDYGGNSWTTMKQADDLIDRLNLNNGTDLIDLGAGTGWPSLYVAQKTGCKVTLVDLPEIGLQIAKERAQTDGLEDRVSVHNSDAADLPFDDASFEAVTHSDLLCCLVAKRAVLHECRRIIRRQGQMAFSVISVTPDLGKSQYARALENAPEFVEADSDYPTLLQQTGWQVDERIDVTDEYCRCSARQVEADTAHLAELEQLLGVQEAEERLTGWKSKLGAVQDGLFLRELYFCRPI